VITVYATTAFVIIELVNNLDPLNLPPNLFTIVVIGLAVGFPLVIVLSWLYDLTSEGVEKTKPVNEIQEGKKRAVPNAWKLATYVSFVVIIGLVTYNIVAGTKGLRSGDIQSLAILPFNNYTGDDQLEWVAAGMHSSLIGDMGKVSGLRVLGETTSRAYKEANMTATDIAEKDNVEAIVEPTLTCYGDMVCVQVKVVTTYPVEKVIWVEDYMEDKSQILNLYTRIARKIADELKVNLTLQEETLLAETRIIDPEAYDSYLMGIYLLEDADLESLNKAREYLNSAVEKNPDWAPLYSSLAQVWALLVQMNFESPEIAGPKIIEYRNKALELDPNNADVHFTNGMIAFLTEWDWEKAEMELLKALAANPNDAMSRVIYAQLLGCLQRPGESLTQGRLAIELDPLNPLVQALHGALLMNIGDFKTVLAYGEKITAGDPGHLLANTSIVFAAFYYRDYNKVMEADKYVLAHTGVDFKEVERIFGETGFVATL
jgi:TolB-like protein/Tfp pilus assembly protein PilF